MHVKQAPCIGRKAAHWRGEGMSVMAGQGHLFPACPVGSAVGIKDVCHRQQGGRLITGVVTGVRAGAGRVFPLGLSR